MVAKSFIAVFTGAVMGAMGSAGDVEAQSVKRETLFSYDPCAQIKTEDNIRDCQAIFIRVANDIVERQKKILSTPHYEPTGRRDDPEMVLKATPPMLAAQLTGLMNDQCADIGAKHRRQAGSERLDDGTRIGLLRIAERAGRCATIVEAAAAVAHVPYPFGFVVALKDMADNVKKDTNRIALAY